MSALSDLVGQFKHQAYLLEEAEVRDGVALEIIDRPRAVGKRKGWTRQDENRLQCHIETDALKSHDPIALHLIWHGKRADTRVARVLRRICVPSTADAAAEINAARMHYVLPLIEAARKAHVRLFEFYLDRSWNWREVIERHNEAMEALLPYVGSDHQALAAPEVDLSLNQIRYKGECYDVSSDAALLMKALTEANGEWIRASTISTKPSRVKDSLPATLKELIETGKGKGYRLKVG